MQYVYAFAKEESGVETMEWIAIICVCAALIGIAAQVASKLKTKTKAIASHI